MSFLCEQYHDNLLMPIELFRRRINRQNAGIGEAASNGSQSTTTKTPDNSTPPPNDQPHMIKDHAEFPTSIKSVVRVRDSDLYTYSIWNTIYTSFNQAVVREDIDGVILELEHKGKPKYCQRFEEAQQSLLKFDDTKVREMLKRVLIGIRSADSLPKNMKLDSGCCEFLLLCKSYQACEANAVTKREECTTIELNRSRCEAFHQTEIIAPKPEPKKTQAICIPTEQFLFNPHTLKYDQYARFPDQKFIIEKTDAECEREWLQQLEKFTKNTEQRRLMHRLKYYLSNRVYFEELQDKLLAVGSLKVCQSLVSVLYGRKAEFALPANLHNDIKCRLFLRACRRIVDEIKRKNRAGRHQRHEYQMRSASITTTLLTIKEVDEEILKENSARAAKYEDIELEDVSKRLFTERPLPLLRNVKTKKSRKAAPAGGISKSIVPMKNDPQHTAIIDINRQARRRRLEALDKSATSCDQRTARELQQTVAADAEISKSIAPPKTDEPPTYPNGAAKPFQLRVQAAIDRMNVPAWYKQHAVATPVRGRNPLADDNGRPTWRQLAKE